MVADEALDLVAVGGEGADRRRLVVGHEAAVADHVGVEDRGELALAWV